MRATEGETSRTATDTKAERSLDSLRSGIPRYVGWGVLRGQAEGLPYSGEGPHLRLRWRRDPPVSGTRTVHQEHPYMRQAPVAILTCTRCGYEAAAEWIQGGLCGLCKERHMRLKVKRLCMFCKAPFHSTMERKRICGARECTLLLKKTYRFRAAQQSVKTCTPRSSLRSPLGSARPPSSRGRSSQRPCSDPPPGE